MEENTQTAFKQQPQTRLHLNMSLISAFNTLKKTTCSSNQPAASHTDKTIQCHATPVKKQEHTKWVRKINTWCEDYVVNEHSDFDFL